MELYIVAAVVLLVALVGAGLAYFVPRRRRPPAPIETKPAETKPAETKPAETKPAETKPAETKPAETKIAEPPAEAPVDEAPKAPVLEVPEPTAGRLVRLRARLSKSQSVFGKGLLALLSRDKLDDDTWDEIEETLIG